MATQVEKIIIKHYGKGKRFKTRGWEECGQEIDALIQSKQEKLLNRGFPYQNECEMCAHIRMMIEREYESFFKVGSFYSWINGNEKLKILIG